MIGEKIDKISKNDINVKISRTPMRALGPENYTALFLDRERSEVYAGTLREGIRVFDAVSGRQKRQVGRMQPGENPDPFLLKGARVYSFAKDRQGYLWIASDGGLNRYDPVSGKVVYFLSPDKKHPNPSSNSNQCLLMDRNGHLWIGSMGGLSRVSVQELSRPFEDKNLHFDHFVHQPNQAAGISNNVVICLLESAAGQLWVGTEAGLNRYDPAKGTWRWYFVPDGLPDNELVSLVEDRKGDIWIATAHEGLAKLDARSGRFFRFNKKNGLCTDQFRPNAGICAHDGSVLLGGRTGLAGFYPDTVAGLPPLQQTLLFTDIQLFNQSIPVGKKKGQLAEPVYQTKSLQLAFNENVLRIEFSALNFIYPEKQLYRYRLLPNQPDWIDNGNKREVNISYLAPGSYQLQVETSENGYDWTGRSLVIRITPPWFRSWWAYLLYALTAAAGLLTLRRFELKRQQAREEALRWRELDQAKTRLYDNITHEFRTPLTVILGMEEQLRKDPDNWLSEALRLIRSNSLHLLQLVNQLLDLSKLESGHLPLRLVQGDVVAYLQYLTEAFHSYAESKDIRLHFRADLQALTMDHDPEKLQNVMSNLLSNAIKFTPAGGDVYVDVRLINKPPQVLLLQVEDTGQGIDAAHLPHIFDRFYQADDSNTRKNEGSGIGLAMVRELLRLMGGGIVAESVPGNGTKFVVQLPVRHTAAFILLAEAAAPAPPPAGLLPEAVVSGMSDDTASRNTVLIVEDNADVITYLSAVLQTRYHIETARNGQEGIDKALELVPDVIVSDVMMPDKDGFELCRELKTDERSSHIPVILLTAKSGQQALVEGLGVGADAYLAKPFHREELLVRIEKLIQLRQNLQKHYRKTGSLQQDEPVKPLSLDERFVQKTMQVIDVYLPDEDFGMPQLCKELNMSRSNLFRKIKALTGLSVTLLIRNRRLEKARTLLENTDMNVTEVCFAVGFNSPNYFSRVFQDEYGVVPSALRKA